MNFDWTVVVSALPDLLEGLRLTLVIALAGLVGGVALGIFSGVILTYGSGLAAAPAHAYVALIRGTPIVVQVMFVYFALPIMMGIRISATSAAITTLIVNSGAYNAEIVRGALGSVPIGLREAGLAMGIPFRTVLARVIAPVAFRRALPAMGNQFVSLVKDTSIFLVIGVGELTRRGQEIMAENFRAVEIWTAVAVIYLIVISLLALGLRVLERGVRLP
ncbi:MULTISPECIES: ABC transporter permease subunit [Paraburkholderia]|uniref:ABC transporter permease subunit n=1 Tax=Paraburkholderia TaxID=1822464 RepID=UPI002250329E|nr:MULTISPECIES: ABC transporter permease subunit [Paraburkholderia]MCX4161784.1 ABC transporter permease subunit [Paraburkholderia megapolitana]MDN7157281.1 ABC transporter permease subunit [Paraburkholderia sp. CHISQ3]MDQ6494326.1 ABC transporter permease subunit [Paraburkholderia megapolitana]